MLGDNTPGTSGRARVTEAMVEDARALNARLAMEVADAFEKTAESALTAHDLGTRLLEIRANCPAGMFLSVIATIGVSPERAIAAIRIASGYRRSEMEARKSDALRQFALGFTIPAKEIIEQQGNAKLNTNKTYRRWLNEFEGWRQRAEKGLTKYDADALRRDTKEMFRWFQVLHSPDSR